jgi:predicted TIM-barrel fold metal-dependent hydrolase
MKYKVIDCHAHVFPPAAGASGFADAATHLLHEQRAMHLHGNQPYRRTRDDAIVAERPLWDPRDPSPAGRKDVDFRVGACGRFEWTAGGEDYHVQFLPPWMRDLSMSAEQLVAMMDYAGIGAALLQNDHIYGNLGAYFAEAAAAYPGRFVITAQVEEAFAYRDAELERLWDQITRLHAGAVYFTTTGMFRSGYAPMHSDPAYDPFWQAVERSKLPVCWVQSANSPIGSYEDEMRHLETIIGRFPNIHHVLVHGVPTALYADEQDKLKLPAILRSLLASGHVSAEILYPIAWGGKSEYPYVRAQSHTRQLIEMFGVERFVWGSDEPNVERYCTYAQALEYFTRHSAYLSDAERQAILYDNALRIFPAFAALAEAPR